jgi:hypothetical protein
MDKNNKRSLKTRLMETAAIVVLAFLAAYAASA